MSEYNWKKILPWLGMIVPMAGTAWLQRDKLTSFEMLVWQVLLIFGFAAAWVDLRKKRVPNKLVGAMLGAWVLLVVPQLFYRTGQMMGFLFDAVAGCLIGGLLFLAVYIVSRKGLGGGDVKLMAVSGLYLGADGILPVMLYGSVLASLYGVTMILLKKMNKKDSMPLVPFLFAGMVLTIWFVL